MDDLEQQARALLPEPVYRYFQQGAGAGVSRAEDASAWRRWRFLPHTLRDVSEVSLQTTLLGTAVTSPIAIAPTTLQRHADPDGEIAMARGAAAAGTLLAVSSNAGSRFEDVAKEGAPWWLQAYVLADRSITAEMMARATGAGAAAVVVTVDTPVVGSKRGADPDVWALTPAHYLHANEDRLGGSEAGLEKATDLTAETINWLADTSGLPVVLKGVLRADDAEAGVDAGAAAIWVSNHGGRQLDRAIAPAAAVGPVVDTVAGRAEVYVDGGITEALDVATALCLGASAVFLGRLPLWALTVGGAAGVARLLAGLNADLVEAMQLLGAGHLEQLDRSLLTGP